MGSRGVIIFVLIYGAVAASAVALAQLRHQQRQTQAELQEARAQARDLAAEAGQLELERATLAAPAMIEERAREELDMVLPREIQVLGNGATR